MPFEISEKSQRQAQKANKRKDPYKEGKVHSKAFESLRKRNESPGRV